MTTQEFLKHAIHLLNEKYPKHLIYEPTISEEEQAKEIDKLKNVVKYEQFFFVLNILEQKLEHIHGVSEWLGYPDSTFDLMKYFRIIHPLHVESLFVSAESGFDTANSGRFDVKFMSDRIVVQLPLLNSQDKYILCKRTLYPFQIDKNGRVISYLNHYIVLKEYSEFDNLHIEVRKENQLKATDELAALRNRQFDLLLKDKTLFGFNFTELRILHFIANHLEFSNEQVCESLGISINTLNKTHNHRIITKARQKFDYEHFKTIKDVAFYLKRQGVF